MSYIYTITLTSSHEEAKKIAHGLLRKRLAACINVTKNITSIYRWKNEIIEDSEIILLIKTRKELFKEVEKEIRSYHSYELPPIFSIPFGDITQDFAKWIEQNTSKEKK